MRQFLSLQPRQLVNFPPWVDAVITFVVVVSTIGLIVTFFMWRRNHKVYTLRMHLVRLVYAAYAMDELLGIDGGWRYDVLASVTYQTMFRQFWRPLNVVEWYPDIAFIIPSPLNTYEQKAGPDEDQQAIASADSGR